MKVNKKSGHAKVDRLRQALANETAKIITTEGVKDFHRAKIKASERLGNSQYGSLPSNFEIEQAINSFQNTFLPEYKENITAQRRAALEVMQWLQLYRPFLAGSVLEGTSGVSHPISIHVASDTVESVVKAINYKNIKVESTERRLKLNNEFVNVPTISFEFQNFEVDVLVFTLRQQFQQPKSKSQNRSMQRVNIKGLQDLLHSNDTQD